MNITTSDERTVTAEEARSRLSELLESVSQEDAGPVTITADGKPVAVLVSSDVYEALWEARMEKDVGEIFAEFDEVNRSLTDK
ncbi:type II toxin-antitoxin system Phd/YefM family antitoxin [Sutterella sp.]|uniref:type II toxin-antitoxin system Phd/YefM family antitoxin n=1 Tax=Sutterella sp. TaxID=1981025 RepID=UPI0026DFC746|nr:type II toxin-antitoxin system Phd/YefM family antitoxin [Sutterella sp.]MDO5531882.1 type II toxin-antitoxin system Phd/YefM family antitoxin [Sutterella sp.]